MVFASFAFCNCRGSDDVVACPTVTRVTRVIATRARGRLNGTAGFELCLLLGRTFEITARNRRGLRNRDIDASSLRRHLLRAGCHCSGLILRLDLNEFGAVVGFHLSFDQTALDLASSDMAAALMAHDTTICLGIGR